MTSYKPSPLSFNSPRTSPFRRPNTPLTHSPSTRRPTTPSSSPLKPTHDTTPSSSPLKPPKETTPTPSSPVRPVHSGTALPSSPPSWLNTRGATQTAELPTSPSRPEATRQISSSTQATVRPTSTFTASIAARFESQSPGPSPAPPISTAPIVKPVEKSAPRPTPRPVPVRTASSDALSRLPPPLLHSMRESFSVLDRDNTGFVDSADVADMLSQLGLSATPSMLATYFEGAQSINLATYLNTLSDLLSGLSHPRELNAAFAAFDDADDGQIDLGELKDALLHTAPEPGERKLTEREIDMVVEGFSGRRAFGKGGKGLGRGEVFRYQEFMASITGGSGNADGAPNAAAPA